MAQGGLGVSILGGIEKVFGRGFRWPCLSRSSDKLTFRGTFHPEALGDLKASKAQSSPDLRAQSSLSVLQAAGRL